MATWRDSGSPERSLAFISAPIDLLCVLSLEHARLIAPSLNKSLLVDWLVTDVCTLAHMSIACSNLNLSSYWSFLVVGSLVPCTAPVSTAPRKPAAVVVHEEHILEKPADEGEIRRNIASYAVSKLGRRRMMILWFVHHATLRNGNSRDACAPPNRLATKIALYKSTAYKR